jgi:hypothetical protein
MDSLAKPAVCAFDFPQTIQKEESSFGWYRRCGYGTLAMSGRSGVDLEARGLADAAMAVLRNTASAGVDLEARGLAVNLIFSPRLAALLSLDYDTDEEGMAMTGMDR